MSDAPIPQMEPSFGPEEAAAVHTYMERGGWITEFKETERFEGLLRDYTGAKHCIVVNNGTVSLTLAAIACGIGVGDEVIVPNYTMIATPNSVRMIGATPVFVDVEADTLCMDVQQVERAITPKTKAVVFVSANGRYPRSGIAAFSRLCANRNLTLIEDAAQSLGSHYPDGPHMGRVGRVGSFSFSAPKVISTGQGGALITDDDDVAGSSAGSRTSDERGAVPTYTIRSVTISSSPTFRRASESRRWPSFPSGRAQESDLETL